MPITLKYEKKKLETLKLLNDTKKKNHVYLILK